VAVQPHTPPARRRAPVRTGVRPEIQALRAVAVAIVVVYHLWPDALPGGFAGVDVFFVISGFLITGLLLREAERRGTVSLPGFWARRVRRILPASLVTLLFCALATIAFVPLDYWARFLADARASALYVQNWHLAHTAVDYFAQAASGPSPEEHFWSLSVEEQFYLAWPVLLALAVMLGRRDPRRALALTMAAVTAGSLAYSLLDTASSQATAYFVTPARAWELGAGGLLALLPDLRGSPVARSVLSWLGLGAIALAAALYSDRTPFPGSAATLPVLGALFVMRAGMPPRAWSPSRAMALRPVQWLGDVSYSVYLWHWPLIVLAPIVLNRSMTTALRLAILALTLLVAWLSKVALEDPIRRSRAPHRYTFSIAALATGAVVGVSLAGTAHLHAQVRAEKQASQRVLATGPRCFGAAARDPRHPCTNPKLRLSVVPTPIEAQTQPNAPCRVVFYLGGKDVCEFGARKGSETVALIGDSHAGVYRIPLDAVAKARGWRGLRFGHSSCPLSAAPRDLDPPERADCTRWRAAVVGWLGAHPDVHTVFVSELASGRGVVTHRGQSQFETAVKGYQDAWSALPASVQRVLVIRDNPSVSLDTNACVERAMTAHEPAGAACALKRSESLDPDPAATAARRLHSPRVKVLDLTPFFCDARRCYPVIGGVLVYKDTTHLTGLYARTLGPYLARAVTAAVPPARAGGR
jgi:peptidoglycan/LPS O-acetylase OafA/YrhL